MILRHTLPENVSFYVPSLVLLTNQGFTGFTGENLIEFINNVGHILNVFI